MIDEVALRATRFEPVALELRYVPPRATVHPDTSLGWVRRVRPLLVARWQAFAVAMAIGVVALVVQVQIPAVLRSGIDQALVDRTEALSHFMWLLIALAVGRFVTGALYRYLLFRAGYLFETDLRAIVYEHLTRLSFSYFDRTQSGQVISRANSDIRSIQLLLTFGPLVMMSGLTFVFAFAKMLQIHVGLSLVAMSTMPLVYLTGSALRKRVFPLSWLVQARMADAATIVDENINGIRVVHYAGSGWDNANPIFA